MMKKAVSLVSVLVTAVLMTGCSFFAPTTQTIHINGTPADATVTVNGQKVKIPATMEMQRNKNITIVVRKDGYEPFEKTTGYSLSPVGTLDVIGCWFFLLPGAGLFTPGAWELMESNFQYTLTPSGAKDAPKAPAPENSQKNR